MITKKRFAEANWKMSYEQYKACYCPECPRKDCPHRDAYRRVPKVDGGLGLCLNFGAEAAR